MLAVVWIFFFPLQEQSQQIYFNTHPFSPGIFCFPQITHNSGSRASPFSKTPLRAHRENPALPFINWNHHCVMQLILELSTDEKFKKNKPKPIKMTFLRGTLHATKKGFQSLDRKFPCVRKMINMQ